MTVEEVKNTLPLDNNGNVYISLFDCFISAVDFITRYDGAFLTYESLSSHPNTTTGWNMQFDDWKEKGILI